MIIIMIVLIFAIFALLILSNQKDLLIIDLTNESKFRFKKMMEKDNQIADLIYEKEVLKSQFDSWNYCDSKLNLSDKDFKTILQYIHPDKTGKDTHALFIKVKEMKEMK